MYVYGNFYDRFDVERVKIKLDDAEVAALAAAYAEGEEAYEDAYENFNEKHDGIGHYITLSALGSRLEDVGHLNGTFVADEEEWLLACGPSEDEVKKAFAEAVVEEDDGDWDE